MANTNFIEEGNTLSVACTYPASPTVGVPVLFGSLTGVSMTAEGEDGNSSTKATVWFDEGVFDLSVTDNATGGIAVGDPIYLHGASPCTLDNVATSGYFFGYALEAVTGSGTDTINVLHVMAPGAGTTPADTSVTTAKIGTAAVTAAKLSATLKKGWIGLDISDARLISANEFTTSVGPSTDPTYTRNNTSTDIAGRLTWASASVLEVQFRNLCIPYDIDVTAPIVVHFLARMKAGSVNTPVLTVKAFVGEGDTNRGGNTAALSTTLANVSVSLTAAAAFAYPTMLAISVYPGAHATASNDVYVFGAWIEYTRA